MQTGLLSGTGGAEVLEPFPHLGVGGMFVHLPWQSLVPVAVASSSGYALHSLTLATQLG